MKQLEDELKNLFRRKEPSGDFAGRMMAWIGAEPPRVDFLRRTAGSLKRPVLRWAVVAATCVAIAFGVVQHRREQQRQAQAERAKEQAILALQITNAKLSSALEQARRITVHALAAPETSKTRIE